MIENDTVERITMGMLAVGVAGLVLLGFVAVEYTLVRIALSPEYPLFLRGAFAAAWLFGNLIVLGLVASEALTDL